MTQLVDMPNVPDTTPEGCQIVYTIGWHLVPVYIRNNLHHFVKFSARDAAFFKHNRGAQGTLYLEATLDAGRFIHPMHMGHLLSSECDFGHESSYEATGKAIKADVLQVLCMLFLSQKPTLAPTGLTSLAPYPYRTLAGF